MLGQKIIGLILLILGIAIIAYILWYSFNIFTAKISPPEIFKTTTESNDNIPAPSLNLQGLGIDLEKLAGEQIQKQIESVMPMNAVPRLLNLISWSILAGIFILGGSQIANMGINLIKK